jgi:Diaphanous GTPase-binding Domain
LTPFSFIKLQDVGITQHLFDQHRTLVISAIQDALSSGVLQEGWANGDCSEPPSSELSPGFQMIRFRAMFSRPELRTEQDAEWFVKKSADKTITVKQLKNLAVILREQPTCWVQTFVERHGQVVLTNALSKLADLGQAQVSAPIDREYYIIQCLGAITLTKFFAKDGFVDQQALVTLSSCLSSVRFTTRLLVTQMLPSACFGRAVGGIGSRFELWSI